jgi:hypothetical protein
VTKSKMPDPGYMPPDLRLNRAMHVVVCCVDAIGTDPAPLQPRALTLSCSLCLTKSPVGLGVLAYHSF